MDLVKRNRPAHSKRPG